MFTRTFTNAFQEPTTDWTGFTKGDFYSLQASPSRLTYAPLAPTDEMAIRMCQDRGSVSDPISSFLQARRIICHLLRTHRRREKLGYAFTFSIACRALQYVPVQSDLTEDGLVHVLRIVRDSTWEILAEVCELPTRVLREQLYISFPNLYRDFENMLLSVKPAQWANDEYLDIHDHICVDAEDVAQDAYDNWHDISCRLDNE